MIGILIEQLTSKAEELDVICSILDTDNVDMHAVREWLSLMKELGHYKEKVIA